MTHLAEEDRRYGVLDVLVDDADDPIVAVFFLDVAHVHVGVVVVIFGFNVDVLLLVGVRI